MSETQQILSHGRGRPNAHRVAAIDRAILLTARNRFLEEGYDAVSMEAVASAARISKSTLYSRYRSKEALFTAIIEATVQEWAASAASDDHLVGPSIAEKLHHHARSISRSQMQADVRAFQKLLITTRERFPGLSRAMHDAGYLYIVQLITRDIEAAASHDNIPVKDAPSIGRLMVNAIAGAELQELLDDPHDLDKFAARTVDLLLAARASW